MGETIKVIVVDDSASVRQILSEILGSDPGIEVIAASSDPIIALNHMKKEWPDVIVSDIEMPRKDGITFVREIMAERPTPVVICSALTEKNARISMEAMAAGAVYIISKPKVGMKDFLYESGLAIIDAVKSAARANVKMLKQKPSPVKIEPKLTADAVLSPAGKKSVRAGADKIVAIGASAGGTQAVEHILKELTPDCPGIVIVQHMPEKFTEAFAARLNNLCDVEVREAADGDRIVPGTAYIAPGNRHTIVERQGNQYRITVKDGPLVSRHRPSVDVLFRSVARCAGDNALGIILTGMGDDGARGMVEMKNIGVRTIAQDKETSIVFGMPKEAIDRGGVDRIVPLQEISREIAAFHAEGAVHNRAESG